MMAQDDKVALTYSNERVLNGFFNMRGEVSIKLHNGITAGSCPLV